MARSQVFFAQGYEYKESRLSLGGVEEAIATALPPDSLKRLSEGVGSPTSRNSRRSS